MASIINASTSGVGGVITTADNSGDLNIQSGGSTKIAVTSAGVALTGLSKASLPTGSVLQVVNATYTGTSSTSSTTYVNTGLTASITPTSATSKILIFYSACINVAGGGVDSGAVIGLTNGSVLFESNYYVYLSTNLSEEAVIPATQSYLHSPASTSLQTYVIQMKQSAYGGVVNINNYAGAGSSITLMEIAA